MNASQGAGARRRLFLHIGTHKTGTTSIQVALTRARDELATRGICYPNSGVSVTAQFGQHALAWAAVERPTHLPRLDPREGAFDADHKARLWERLRVEIESSGAHTAVISSEEFDVLSREEILAVGRELEMYDVTPVLFLRNIADLLESSYRTSVIAGYRRTAAEFAANQRTRIDYAAAIGDWRDIAADRAAIVFFYDDQSIRRDVVTAFFDLLGAGDLEQVQGRNENESVPAFVCEIVRFLRDKECPEPSIARWIANMRQAPFAPSVNHDFSVLSPETRAALDARYAGELAALDALPDGAVLRRGDPAFSRSGAPSEVSNIVSALVALGHALGQRERPATAG